MKIVVASTVAPFIRGGATLMVDWLVLKLKEYGHIVDVVNIPFSNNYQYMMEQMVGLRLYNLEDACDRLICIRMPSYLLKHPDKYLWFIHHYREVYDLWGTKYQGIPNTDEGLAVREYIMRADKVAFTEAKQIYTNSKIISKRLKDYNDMNSQVVYPPLLNPEQFRCDEYGDYIYYPSRICNPKRQDLAIQAMKYTKSNVKLLITGKSEDIIYRDRIHNIIKKHDLGYKVKIVDNWISEQEKAKHFSNALAGLYIPYNEDSYGYPSLEAHHSEKLVISCKDSGGTDELIEDGYNGFLVEPDPEQLAQVFDRLYMNKKVAIDMGKNALQQVNRLNITWDNVIRRFTS